MKVWEVKQAQVTSKAATDLLGEGWEPFTVTIGSATGINYLWLRRQVDDGKRYPKLPLARLPAPTTPSPFGKPR